jgi:hypothetical protein
MTKLKRPTGLVRYDSHVGLHGGKTRFIRPRIIFYTLLLLLGLGAFLLSVTRISPMSASAVRMIGAPFYVADGVLRNQFLIRVINKYNSPSTYQLEMEGEIPPQLSISGLVETLELAALGEEQKTLVLSLPESAFQSAFKLRVKVTDLVHGHSVTTREMEFLGPDSRLKSNEPLDAKDFIQ